MKLVPRDAIVLVLFACVACAELKATVPDDAGAADAQVLDDAGADATPSVDAGQNEPTEAGTDGGAAHVVFVTTAKVDGAFGSAGNPLAAADAICATEASANSLTGDFVAWLSYVDGNGTSFNASTRIPDVAYAMPGNVVDGGAPVLVVASKTELLTTGPRVAMDRTATGTQIEQDENSQVTWVWTGTDGYGLAASQTCTRWTSALPSGSGVAGNARRIPSYGPSDWTSLGGRTCDVKRRFFCFQK